MTPLRSRRLPQLTSKPSCAYSPLGVDAASTVWWARRFAVCRWDAGASALVVPGGVGRRCELAVPAVPGGVGRRCLLAVPGRQRRGGTVCSRRPGQGAVPCPGFAKQGAVLGQQMRRGAQSAVCSRRPVRGRCRCRGGRTGGCVKDALFGQICTSRSHFPRSLLFKGANLPKPVHASRPRPTRTPPTPHTHPPTPHPQMPNRTKNRQIYLPLPYFPRSLSPKTQICRFFVLSSKNHRRMTLKKACPETTLESGQAFCCEKLSYLIVQFFTNALKPSKPSPMPVTVAVPPGVREPARSSSESSSLQETLAIPSLGPSRVRW